MSAARHPARGRVRICLALAAALVLSACDLNLNPQSLIGGSGPSVAPGEAVPVALLVPQSDAGAAPVAQSLENAARLAIAENPGASIDLRVYDTGGSSQTAAAQAQRAVDDGAKIILGPLFGAAANAAGLAVLDDGVNVLSFSNNPSIAGGNVFVLGQTFDSAAERLMAHARRQGDQSVAVIYSNDVLGSTGRLSIERAAAQAGIRVIAAEGFDFSEASIASAISRTAAVAGSADAVFVATDVSQGAMPRLLEGMPQSGIDPAIVQYIALGRLDTVSTVRTLRGAEGMWFTLPDQSRQAGFEGRYQSTYGSTPHPLAGLGYDAISAVSALVQEGRRDALSATALTRGNGFNGTGGIFRLTPNGTNQRALAVAALRNNQVVILDPAPNSFGGAGF